MINKKIIKGVLIAIGISLGVANQSNAQMPKLLSTSGNRPIMIRPGEYPNKPGKRLLLDKKEEGFNVPVRYDTSYHIQEHDINEKIAKALYKYLEENYIDVHYQDTYSKWGDLNSAGKKFNILNPLAYISIHTNAHKEDSTGYFFITNEGDKLSEQYANNFNEVLKDNPVSIPSQPNRINDGYIGELNTSRATIKILGEFGYALTNKEECKKVTSDEYINYIAQNMGSEIIKMVNNIN